MTSLANTYSARDGAKFAAFGHFAAESSRRLCKSVLAAMQTSREREAERIIAHYRHLTDDQTAGMLREQTSQKS